MVQFTVYYYWYEHGIFNIHDLLDVDGRLYTYNNFCRVYDFRPPFTVYEGLKRVIIKTLPTWREGIDICGDSPMYPQLINIILTDGNRIIYKNLVHSTGSSIKKTYIIKWNDEFDIEKDDEWWSGGELIDFTLRLLRIPNYSGYNIG